MRASESFSCTDCPSGATLDGLIFALSGTASPNPCLVRHSAVPRAQASFSTELCSFPQTARSLSLIVLAFAVSGLRGAESAAAAHFHQSIEPLLSKYCYDCHGNGVGKGRVAFDEFNSDAEILAKRDLWLAALKNVRAGLMPPREEDLDRPTEVEIGTLANWIKYDAFGIDPKNPDPGRVTARRLNRIEYHNTIRDLMGGFDFNSEVEFPPDDSGNGFDNNGDALTISPLLLEKYLSAAEFIVEKAVPKVSRIMRERVASGRDFRSVLEGDDSNGERLNLRNAAKVARTFRVDRADKYRVDIELEVRGSFDFDAGHGKLICRIDDEQQFVEDVVWSERKTLKHEFDVEWKAGSHVVSFAVEPLAPVDVAAGETAAVAVEPTAAGGAPAFGGNRQFKQSATSVTVRVASVAVRGPLNPEFWNVPENYTRFFPNGPAPKDAAGRDAHAAELLRSFATRAFRRPVDEPKVKELVTLARQVYTQPGKSFEEGVGRAMMAVLGSPRFLFRIEQPVATAAVEPFAPVDEYALASRLSYFLWSTMPDDELFELAARGELRRDLRAQVARMLKDAKAQAFVRNFTGQWLQARDVESVPINARVVMGPNAVRNKDGRIEFDGAFRRMMRSETEMYFDHVVREDRSVLELVDSDYTFLNGRLAAHYGIPGVTGETLHLVKLPEGSPRGGMLTQGTVLAVTSNPTRTSPVKRGLFILENILGTPPPPPPPDVPDLEEAKKGFTDHEPKLSEMLAVHRANKLCNSCHSRMDPLGLALENFNALGSWRDTEAGQPIEPAGRLITGEKFADVRALKHVLSHERKLDVYRCLTEKLLTYALGRGLDYYDTHTIDDIVDQLAREDGRMSVLLFGVIESPAFQKMRALTSTAQSVSLSTPARTSSEIQP